MSDGSMCLHARAKCALAGKTQARTIREIITSPDK